MPKESDVQAVEAPIPALANSQILVSRFMDRFPEGIAQMAQWIKEGKLKYREQIVAGFENAPRALIGVLQGDNTGKMLVAMR